jgi:hypothetical protein
MDADRSGGGGGEIGMRKDKLTAELAYRLWQENGCVEGRALDYWLEAERKLGVAEPRNGTQEG